MECTSSGSTSCARADLLHQIGDLLRGVGFWRRTGRAAPVRPVRARIDPYHTACARSGEVTPEQICGVTRMGGGGQHSTVPKKQIYTILFRLTIQPAFGADIRYHHLMTRRCTARGFVLAGGRSSRMGRDKALLAARRRNHARVRSPGVCAGAAGNVTLIGPPERYARARAIAVIADQIDDCGPLGGVYTALARHRRRLESDGRLRYAGASPRAFRRPVPGRGRSSTPTASFREADRAATPCAPSIIAGCARARGRALDRKISQNARFSLHSSNVSIWPVADPGGALDNINTPAEWSAR